MEEKEETVVKIKYNFVKVIFEIVARLALVLLVMKSSTGNLNPIIGKFLGTLLLTWAIIPLVYGIRQVYLTRRIRY